MAERYSSIVSIPSWIRNEHHARYEFVGSFVRDKVAVVAACGERSVPIRPIIFSERRLPSFAGPQSLRRFICVIGNDRTSNG